MWRVLSINGRYVDTFNKGGGNTVSSFQSPSVPSAKPAAGSANPKFFVPTPISAAEQPVIDTLVDDNRQIPSTAYENPSSSPPNDSFHSPHHSSSSPSMQRFGSMSNIYNRDPNDSSFAVHSRRTASWGGSLNDSMSPPNRTTQSRPLEALGMQHRSPFMPSDTSLAGSSVNGGSFGEDLHEVELWYSQDVHNKFCHTATETARFTDCLQQVKEMGELFLFLFLFDFI